MALRASSGYSSLILGPYAFEEIFHRGCIEVYTGTQPADGNAAPTGTLLGRITINGAAWSLGNVSQGLVFLRTGQYISKPLVAQWAMDVIATGNAGWWRLVSQHETGGPSYELPRLDGAISATPDTAEWTVPNTGMAAGSTVPIDSFTLTIPPIPA